MKKLIFLSLAMFSSCTSNTLFDKAEIGAPISAKKSPEKILGEVEWIWGEPIKR